MVGKILKEGKKFFRVYKGPLLGEKILDPKKRVAKNI